MRHVRIRFLLFLGAVVLLVTPALIVETSPAHASLSSAATPPHRASTPSSPPKAGPEPGDRVPRGIMPQRGAHGAIPPTGPASTPPTNSPLFFQGGGPVNSLGVIEGPPRVYIVYWGNQWGAAGTNSKGDYTFSNDAQSMVPRQQDLFRDLGANGETWSGVTTQYCDFVNKGDKSCPSSNPDHVGYPTGGALAGVWYDDSAPEPSSTSGNDIANEAIRAAQHFGNTSSGSNLNNQYVITSPPGIDPAGVYKGGACAWHSSTTQLPWSGDDVAYTNMPYIPDAPANSSGVPGSSCGVGAVNTPGTLDGVTIVGGHEYAETLTDAFGNGGWCGTNGCGADENGDKCAWGTNGAVLQNVPFSKTDNFPMQPTWANDGGGNGSCEINHPIVSDPNPNTPGAKILVVGDSITNGILGDYTWRYRLWQHLSTTSSQNVQFVGHRTGTENIYDDPGDLDLVNGNPAPTDNYANPTDGYYNSTVDSQFTCFDCGENHDALWGWTYVLAQNYIGQEVKTYQPNYMLIELGFNDLAFFTSPSGTLANAKALIDDARAVDPGIKVLIANVVTRVPLPNFPTLNSTIQTYNSDLAAAVPSWSTAQSPVRMADISSGYDPGTMSYDGLHPNWRGEYEIADAFGTALAQDFGLGTVPGAPPSSVPGYTLTAPSSVDASISATGTLLQWNRVYGVSGYRVYERDITGNPSPLPAFVELPLPLPGDHWYAGWGTPGHTYQYEVAAAKGNTESGPSAPVTITMPNPEPTADKYHGYPLEGHQLDRAELDRPDRQLLRRQHRPVRRVLGGCHAGRRMRMQPDTKCRVPYRNQLHHHRPHPRRYLRSGCRVAHLGSRRRPVGRSSSGDRGRRHSGRARDLSWAEQHTDLVRGTRRHRILDLFRNPVDRQPGYLDPVAVRGTARLEREPRPRTVRRHRG